MLYDTIYRGRFAIAAITIGILVTAYFGVRDLSISTDNRIFYDPGNNYFQEYLAFESAFSSNDNILFVVHAPFRFPEQNYPEAIEFLTNEVRNLDHVIRVDSLATYPYPSSDDDLVTVESFLNWACPLISACRDEQTIEDALQSHHLVNRLISNDGRSVGVVATLLIERGAVGKIENLNRLARELSNSMMEQFPEFEVVFTGGVPMMAAFAQATASDLSILLPLALLIIVVILRVMLGSTSLSALVLLVAFASVVVTLGLAGLSGHVINNATSIVPLIVFILVIASTMHIAIHYASGLRAENTWELRSEQARASYTSNLTPIIVSNATTAASLFSLIFVDSPPLRQLGVLSAVGVIIGLAFTLVLFPAALSSTAKTVKSKLSDNIQNYLNKYARDIESRKLRYQIPLILIVACTAGLFRLNIDDDFVEFFDEATNFRYQTDRATELLSGPNHIEVLLETIPESTVFEEQFMKELHDLSSWLRVNQHVSNVLSFSDIMNEVALAFTHQSAMQARSTEELAQLFLLYELSLQQGQTNTDFLRADHRQARVSVLLTETSSNDIQRLEREILDWHKEQGTNYEITVTGENIPVAHLSEMNISSMLLGIVLSLTFTAILVGAIFKSASMGAIALLATLVPVAAGFGFWGWSSGEIGLAATAIVALTIGIVVDDTVHILYRYIDGQKRLALDDAHSTAYSIHRAGSAIVSTSLMLVIGLGVLLLSEFEVNSTLGAITCLIISTALIFDLFVLPRFLLRQR